MRTCLDCFPCFFQQALRTARMVTSDEAMIWEILKEVSRSLAGMPLNVTPPEIGRDVYAIISRISGIADPFAGIKARCIQEALSLYPQMRNWVETSSDRLKAAVKMSIAGNVIDFGTGREVDLKRDVKKVLDQEFSILDMDDFRRRLETAESILYLADNAGETVFDRLLIEQMKSPVLYAVREKPVINDAVREDAVSSGLESVAQIISSGSDAPGTHLPSCSEEFIQVFRTSDLIISKGQGNYECLSEKNAPIFFLLKAKCPVTAHHIGVQQDGILLIKAEKYHW